MKNILIRYGELTLKGNNRNSFITKLIQNIKYKLKQYKEVIVYKKDHNSLVLEISDGSKVEQISKILQNIFGIYSLSIVEIVEKDLEVIMSKTLEVAMEHSGTFKVEVERKDKSFEISSQELKTKVAVNILKNNNKISVDVHKPQLKITVIIKHNGAFIFTSKIVSSKGLPVGVSGKGLSLLSGGIDSPVASYLTLKRGMQVDFIHFMTPPHTSPEALDKVFKLASKIEKYNKSNFSLYVCDFSMILKELMHIKEESYRITIMRRIFIRIANSLSIKINAQALITGESLGQVASQTIESINVINEVSKLPILRPVLTFDKEEIIEVAKAIDTYETSILPFEDVCSMYVPKNPVTKPKSFIAQKQEENLLLDEIINYTVENLIKTYIWKDGDLVEKQEK
ncbi:tRNA uracil 4-sulfurtransferase ThiI [Spiroplasma diminutum]|uniref:Probable tRNA sulfurtransferase n=1 Tax=Spiroplasma diminutum CUAS-1 TaxID=1276221 RepID=S5M0M8_9MOLU|nr:tRNA uracil 4-sulfurtransferase ThiI [Spiroplasma diminutum]AGR42416.1 thiamine biosynthesis protein ThiI [Spiroplasma diminutum CUAS-1]